MQREVWSSWPPLFERLGGEEFLGECGWQPDHASLIAHNLSVIQSSAFPWSNPHHTTGAVFADAAPSSFAHIGGGEHEESQLALLVRSFIKCLITKLFHIPTQNTCSRVQLLICGGARVRWLLSALHLLCKFLLGILFRQETTLLTNMLQQHLCNNSPSQSCFSAVLRE